MVSRSYFYFSFCSQFPVLLLLCRHQILIFIPNKIWFYMLVSCRPEERKITSSNIYVYTQMPPPPPPPPPHTHTHAHTHTNTPFFHTCTLNKLSSKNQQDSKQKRTYTTSHVINAHSMSFYPAKHKNQRK